MDSRIEESLYDLGFGLFVVLGGTLLAVGLSQDQNIFALPAAQANAMAVICLIAHRHAKNRRLDNGD